MMARITKYIRQLIYSEGMNPLPAKTLTLLFLVMFFMGMTSTMCFSYLPKMVKTFGISEVDTGRYAGYIASSLYVGRIICSYGWGYFGDVKGHKLALILTTAGMIVTTLLFGFSSSYYWALFARLSQGLFLGAIAVSKAILTQQTDETNMALGFAILFSCWTTAFIIGPTIAGFLVFPVEHYPGVFSKDSIFGKFVVLLPNLIVCTCMTITLTLVIIFLPNDKKNRNEPEEEGQYLHEESNNKNYSTNNETNSHNNDCYSLNCGANQDGRSSYSIEYRHEPTVINQPSLKSVNSHTKNKTIIPNGLRRSLSLFRLKDFVVALLMYFLLGFGIIGIEEMFPVFAATSTMYCGLALETSEIGTILLGSSFLLLIIQLTIISKISKRYGPRKTYIGCSLLLLITSPLIPTIYAVEHKTGRTAYAIFIMSINQILLNGITVAVNVLINNTVTPDVYGAANGLATTATSIGRACSPTIFGSIYSWSLTNVKGVVGNENALGFPFNQYFSFIVAGLTYLACALVAMFCLSANADVAREADDGLNTKLGGNETEKVLKT